MTKHSSPPADKATHGDHAKPTVGRVVYFVLPNGAKRMGEIRPAIITRVNPDSVNLSVICDGSNDDGGAPTWVGSVKLDQETKAEGTWHWMPYQIGQAKKTEEVSGSLAEQVAELRAAVAHLLGEKRIDNTEQEAPHVPAALDAPPV